MSLFEASITSAQYGEITALEGISIKADKGQIISMLGANSAGKTTALLSIVNAVKCKKRIIHFDGREISDLPTWKLARSGIIFCPDGSPCFTSMTVLDNLIYVTKVNNLSFKNFALDDVYDFFPVLKQRENQRAGTLSGGERKMLAISRVLMMNPKVLLIDEPSSGLSPKMTIELYNAIKRIKNSGQTGIILAEQNASAALTISDYCIILSERNVVSEGPSEIIRSKSDLVKAYLGS
jgi:branched-chain amino acid transport system ATP-binding protein